MPRQSCIRILIGSISYTNIETEMQDLRFHLAAAFSTNEN